MQKSKLKALREQKGKMAIEVATATGIDQSLYSKYENCRIKISDRHMIKLCVYHRVSPDEITEDQPSADSSDYRTICDALLSRIEHIEDELGITTASITPLPRKRKKPKPYTKMSAEAIAKLPRPRTFLFYSTWTTRNNLAKDMTRAGWKTATAYSYIDKDLIGGFIEKTSQNGEILYRSLEQS